jgi:DNA repair protein RecO (recombination protein O)
MLYARFMRNFKTEGIIIKRRNFKDSDRILTILTKTHGKIYVKASGVRKINSRRAGHIEPLNHVALSLYPGHVFPILTEATTLNNFSEIKSDLDQVGLAYHICELIDGLCPENQENIQVFNLLKMTLEKLSGGGDVKHMVREFEMEVLSILGYLPVGRQDRSKPDPQGSFEPDKTEFDTQNFIENILERRLKSRRIFLKLQG